MRKCLIVFITVLVFCSFLYAGEREQADLAGFYFNQDDYFTAITEAKRYIFLYPNGPSSGEMMLLMGRAYYKGGNYDSASRVFTDCLVKYGDSEAGAGSLMHLGYMRLKQGSSLYAYGAFREYLEAYPGGKLEEEARYYLCYASLFTFDSASTLRCIDEYKKLYPEGNYTQDLIGLEKDLIAEMNKEKKSMCVAVGGSIFLPGFGHFYTGKYKTGFFSLFSNLLCIFMIYNGVQTGNSFQTAFFSLAELSFYRYSLYSAVINVREYNSNYDFLAQKKLSLSQKF